MWMVKVWFLIWRFIAATFNFPLWYQHKFWVWPKFQFSIFDKFFQLCFFTWCLSKMNLIPHLRFTAVTLNGLKFDMLIYPDHLQNWLDFGHHLLIFLDLAEWRIYASVNQPPLVQIMAWRRSGGILLNGPLGTYFSEILTGIQTFSLKKMHLKMSSAKWRPFCLGLNVLTHLPLVPHICVGESGQHWFR